MVKNVLLQEIGKYKGPVKRVETSESESESEEEDEEVIDNKK